VNGADTTNDQGDTPARVSRHDLRNFRALLHHIERDGTEAVTERIGKDALAYARGYLSFIHMVNPDQAARSAPSTTG
jgi:hypothetical protein